MKKHHQLRTLSWTAAILAVFMTLLGLGLTAVPASAASIPGARISITTESTVTSQWDQVDLSCQWSVPNNSLAGDTFTLQLPAELRWFGSKSFDLKNPDGIAVATGMADDSGSVVFTLTDFVTAHPLDIGGTCHFTTQYSVDPGTAGHEELSFTVGSSVVRVPVSVSPCVADCGPSVPTSPGKAMWWVDSSQSELESIIYMPPMASESNDVTVTDSPSQGMVIDCSRVTPRVGRVLNSIGNIAEPYDNELYPARVDCTPGKLTVVWTGLPENEHVELFVVTQVVDPAMDTYTNTGIVEIAGQESAVGAETRRTDASGTGNGSPTATPSQTPSPSQTPTPSPAATSATPEPTATTSSPTPVPSSSPTAATVEPSPTGPGGSEPSVNVPESEADGPSAPLANTGLADSGFVFMAAALLACGSLLAFYGSRRAKRRAH
ncbi:Ig-like domain-containing protein [Paenarthrobacter ilicis]|uniref:SDR-like Ig domain-containing protein n=1 Tax=Paenarthrobacter ilicis TaxID=43665 RepID=A0ABX0TFL0_9MICC|nr:Ig-like domain-containing protein [Paenarthrobacter ilicis]MBM7792071.1 hypothetical protein [Paenarthrobacter ilicis]NIJ01304.1 hypothetical protein [Paenarthrobacter ilicis]